MRLTPEEIENIVKVLKNFLNGCSAELRLFGSRIDDRQRGGDIDLLLLITDKKIEEHLLSQKHYLLSQIKELIGDQKIDLKIANPAQINNDPFLKLIFSNSLFLHRFES